MAETKKYVKTGYYDRYSVNTLTQGDLAGYNKDPYSGGVGTLISSGGFILPRRDDILIQEGGGGARAIEAYMRLFNDSQVISAFNKIIGEIVQREWEVIPAAQDIKNLEVAEFVRIALTKMGTNVKQNIGTETLVNTNSAFDSFIRGLGESLILGISVGEICWTRQGEYTVPSEIKIRDPRRFHFVLNQDGSVSPRLITFDSPYEGIALPLRSMIMHRHWEYASFADPYGAGLGRQLYSLVEFRRTLLSFWIQYADKHTTPTAVGSYELGTPEEEVSTLLAALQRLGQETALVIPKEISVEWLKSEGRPELYTELISYIDQQISYVLCSESTAGQDTGSSGSYARDQISDSIRKRKAKAFSEELDETLNNTLIRWIVELNYPGCLPPTIKRNFDDLRQKDDPIKLIQLLTQMNAIGYKIGDLDWLKDKLDIPSIYVDEGDDAGDNYSATIGTDDAINFADPELEPAATADEEADPIDTTNLLTDDVVDQATAPQGDGAVPQGSESSPSSTNVQKSAYSKSRSQKLSHKVLTNLNGPRDNVGFYRITVDSDNQNRSINRLRFDEFTTPGEIIASCNSLINEIERFFAATPLNADLIEYHKLYSDYKGDTLALQQLVRQNIVTYKDITEMKALYSKIYRLNLRVMWDESICIDTEKLGYWQYFYPYMINSYSA